MARSPRALAVVVGAAAVLTVSSMSGEAAPAPGRALVAATPPQEPTTPTIRLEAVPGAAGISFVHQFGAGGDHIVESGGSGAAWIDYDVDGDVDVLVTNINAPPTLLRNESRLQAPAIRLTLIGRSSNRSAYGAQVRVFSGGIEQLTELRGSDGYIGSNDPRLLIHLPSGIADRIEIDWPSGARTTLEREPAGQIVVDERRGVIARR